MTTWSKEPPSKPGWYWTRLIGINVQMIHRRDSEGFWWLDGEDAPQTYGELASMEFGPRIPTPEAIEAAKDALREAIVEMEKHYNRTKATILAPTSYLRALNEARTALANLGARS